MIFELTAAGFDGGTDETDDLVFWVEASSEEEVAAVAVNTGAQYQRLQGVTVPAQAVDYRLPGDAEALRGKLLEQPAPRLGGA